MALVCRSEASCSCSCKGGEAAITRRISRPDGFHGYPRIRLLMPTKAPDRSFVKFRPPGMEPRKSKWSPTEKRAQGWLPGGGEALRLQWTQGVGSVLPPQHPEEVNGEADVRGARQKGRHRR